MLYKNKFIHPYFSLNRCMKIWKYFNLENVHAKGYSVSLQESILLLQNILKNIFKMNLLWKGWRKLTKTRNLDNNFAYFSIN